MYKLMILFFCLITYNSQSLTDTYELKFANNDATYTLQIKEGSLAFNNQPNVIVVAYGENPSTDTDKAPFDSAQEPQSTSGKTYKITKGATFEEGLKIGGTDPVAGAKIGESDPVAGAKIGESDDVNGGEREMNSLLFGVKDHQAYEIILSCTLVTVVEKSSDFKREFPIAEDGVYLNIAGDKFSLFN